MWSLKMLKLLFLFFNSVKSDSPVPSNTKYTVLFSKASFMQIIPSLHSCAGVKQRISDWALNDFWESFKYLADEPS